MLELLNSKDMTEAGPLQLIDDDDEDNPSRPEALPGVNKDSVKKMPVIRYATRSSYRVVVACSFIGYNRTKHVQFSPSGRSWAAATTEGLMIYSLDETLTFDPFNLDVTITPDSIRETLNEHEFFKALLVSDHEFARDCVTYHTLRR